MSLEKAIAIIKQAQDKNQSSLNTFREHKKKILCAEITDKTDCTTGEMQRYADLETLDTRITSQEEIGQVYDTLVEVISELLKQM